MRAQRDAILQDDIARTYRDNHDVYGVRKVWRQLQRDGTSVARTVPRLMRVAGLQGVVRGARMRVPLSRPHKIRVVAGQRLTRFGVDLFVTHSHGVQGVAGSNPVVPIVFYNDLRRLSFAVRRFRVPQGWHCT